MSAPLSVTVIPGTVLTEGQVITTALLNLLGKPTVNLQGALDSTSIADGSVGTAALASGAVTGAKLAGALLQAFMQPVGTTIWLPKALSTPAPTDGAQWVLCDGSKYAKSDYAALSTYLADVWNALSNAGVNDCDASHFRVPNLQKRVLMGADGGTYKVAPDAGALCGQGSVTLTAAQSGLPAHGHQAQIPNWASGGSYTLGVGLVGSTTPGNYPVSLNAAADASASHTNMQPSAVGLLYILAGYKVGNVWVW